VLYSTVARTFPPQTMIVPRMSSHADAPQHVVLSVKDRQGDKVAAPEAEGVRLRRSLLASASFTLLQLS
jgi:hypothetical protein